jgi:hypothetical protein
MKRKNSRRSGEKGKMIGQETDSLFKRGKGMECCQASPARPSDKGRMKVKKVGWVEVVTGDNRNFDFFN